MPDPSPFDYIEPPAKGFVPPPPPSDAMGLQPRVSPPLPPLSPAPPDELIPSTPNPELPPAKLVGAPQLSDAPPSNPEIIPSRYNKSDVRKQTVDQWVTAGATPVAAEGIARAVNTESGFNPFSMGDYQGSQPTSFGMYQHHDTRAVGLLSFAKAQGKDPHDPAVQTAFAIQETKGGDSVAAAHWKEINNAKTPEEAERLWRQYFERSKGTTLRDQWAPTGSGLSGAVQSAQAELKSQTQAMERSIESAEARMHELALSQEPGSKERQKTLDEGRAEVATLKEKYKLLTASPPIEKPADIFSNFGSPATIIALMGGLFARNHATAALSAAGAAMKAINENNHEAFERSYRTWQNQVKSTAEIIQMQREEINDIVRDEDKAWEHKQTLIAQVFREHGMEMQALQMEHGDARAAFTHLQTLEFNENGIKAQAAQAEKLRHDINVDAGVAKYLDAHPGMTRDQIPADAMATILNAAAPKALSADTPAKSQQQELTREITRRDDKFKADNPGATKDQIDEAHHKNDLASRSEMALATSRSPTGQLSDESVKLLAKQYEMGDMSVITSLPRGGPGRIQVENQIAADVKELPDAAAQIVMNRLRMAEAKSAAQTAGRVTMQTDMYATEARGAGEQVIETSKLFPRSNFPTVNAALAAFEQGTGDPNIVRFGAALNSFINVYGKLSNPTGIGIHDADKERITKIMDRSLSQGQIDAGVAQIITEGQIVANAAREAQVQVLAGIAPTVPSAHPSPAAPSTAVQPQSGRALPMIDNQAAYDALPSGTEFVTRDGKRGKKP